MERPLASRNGRSAIPDENLIDAVDDYIYHARKQGRRLKKNDVYEAALRQFLEAEGVDVR